MTFPGGSQLHTQTSRRRPLTIWIDPEQVRHMDRHLAGSPERRSPKNLCLGATKSGEKHQSEKRAHNVPS